MNVTVVPLHTNKKYITDCCKLINDEWKRSETARMRSLESSSESLPTSLILLQNNERVIGHVKLSPIPSIRDGCFVETVVIEKELRGKGYGTILMRKAEEYCKNSLQLNSIYLSTKGQELFYSKLGYIECSPISIYGSFTLIGNQNNNTLNCNQNVKTINLDNVPIPPPMPIENSIQAQHKTFMKKDI